MFFDITHQASYKQRTRLETATLLVIDVDNFKHINDTFGHTAGDMVLKKIASSLKSSVRDSDLVFRVGGDEFTAIIFCASATVSERIAHCVLNSVSSIDISDDTNNQWSVTVSIGATIIKDGTDIQKTLKEADNAMYSSKSAGKNKVIFSNA